MIEATDATFHREVLEAGQPVMVDFWAPWCGPCRTMGPVVEQIAAEVGSSVRFVKVNVDQAQQTADTYNIRGIPTLMFFSGGKPVGELVGVQPRNAILARLREVQAAAASESRVVTCRNCGQKNRVPASRLREAVCGRCHQALA